MHPALEFRRRRGQHDCHRNREAAAGSQTASDSPPRNTVVQKAARSTYVASLCRQTTLTAIGVGWNNKEANEGRPGDIVVRACLGIRGCEWLEAAAAY